MTSNTGNTFKPLTLNDTELSAAKTISAFLVELTTEVNGFRIDNVKYYENIRGRQTTWTQFSRRSLAWLAVLAFVFTAVATLGQSKLLDMSTNMTADLLVASFVAYLSMGGITLYEKIAGGTDSYFRAVASIVSIRDLWTALQFEWTKTVLSSDDNDAASAKKARMDMINSAQTFATEVEKITKAEIDQWQTGFVAAMTAASGLATKGLDDLKTSIDALAKKQEEAAQAAAADAKTAILNVKIEGDFDGDARILVDNVERAQTHLKSYPIDSVRLGVRKIEVFAKHGDKNVAAATAVECKAGVQDITLTLA
jgi:hypothetical protein